MPHSILRHPDMPRCVFKLLWDTISGGNEIFAYVKNMRKDGDHYWVNAHVTPTRNGAGQIIGYHSNRRVPARTAVARMEDLYRHLRKVETGHTDWREGMAAAGQELLQTLKGMGVEYDEFVSLSNADFDSVEREWIRRAADVCEQAGQGNLEPRILYITGESDLSRLLHGINNLLDLTDAYVRESGACLESAAKGKFFRKIMVRGMLGAFKKAAGLCNAATDEMAQEHQH